MGAWRHGVVGITILGGAGLALAGIIGDPYHDERFDAKQVVVQPVGEDGLRIREVVDEDFGRADRHGLERLIPNDFGVPTDVTATSPDAPDAVDVVEEGSETRIRIGDPDRTVSGQHRYVLTYTLPDAHLASGLFLDIVNNKETLTTEHLEVVVTGLQLDDPACSVGSLGASGGCDLTPDGDVYRVVISPLEPGQGLTVSGRIAGRSTPADVTEPPLPARHPDYRVLLAALMVPLGVASAGAVYAFARRRGRNEVYAGGAADAAYGGTTLPPPGSPPLPTVLVPDSRMGELATTEFVPPKGIAPWQGNVLLREKIDNDTVSAWFSGHAAHDVVTITRDDDHVVLGRGPRFADATPGDAEILGSMFDGGEQIVLDGYDKDFARAWRDARQEMQRSIQASGFWKRLPPGSGGLGCGGALSAPMLIVLAVWAIIGAGSVLTAVLGVFSGPIGAIVFGLVVPALAAFAVYRSLLPARSAAGSALTLRAESFRRFLAASEGRHVEWAWSHGLLREYSAWAVALGAADTWQRAMEQSSVPPAEITTGPLLLWSMGPSFHSSITPPSSSGGGGGSWGGGGGFSGSVGGGGGGGSSGSW